MSRSWLLKSVKSIIIRWRRFCWDMGRLLGWRRVSWLGRFLRKGIWAMLLSLKMMRARSKIKSKRVNKVMRKSQRKMISSMSIVLLLYYPQIPKSPKKSRNKPHTHLKKTSQPYKNTTTNSNKSLPPPNHAHYYWAPAFPTYHPSSSATPMKSLSQICNNRKKRTPSRRFSSLNMYWTSAKLKLLPIRPKI